MSLIPFLRRVYPNREHSFVLSTFDKITEEPLRVNVAYATVYKQADNGGVTTSTIVVPRTEGVQIEVGQVAFVLAATYTSEIGYYVLLWEVSIDEFRKRTQEMRFYISDAPKFSVREGVFIDMLRTFVKDSDPELFRVDPQVERWDDDEFYALLIRSLWDLNAYPPMTSFDLNGLPEQFWDLLLMGAQIFAMIGQGTLEMARDFSYNDNGLSVSLDRTGKYMSAAQALMQHYYNLKKVVKKAYAMANLHWVGIKEQRMPISIRRPLSMLPQLGNVFGRDAAYL